MRSIRPIPRSALPDVMTVRTPLADGTFEEPQIIANVRFERTQKVSATTTALPTRARERSSSTR